MATIASRAAIPTNRMDCDFIAPFYQSVEYLCFGRSLERRRFAFLGELSESRRAIVCGGGDGRFLARLLHSNTKVMVDFVDLSRRMAELAECRISGLGARARCRVKFHVEDVREFAAGRGEYDLVVTNFFLDCFSPREVVEVVQKLASWAAPGAIWMVSEFRKAEGPMSRYWTSWIIRCLYGAFRMTTGLRPTRIPDYAAALHESGFEPLRVEHACRGLLTSSLWQKNQTS